MDRSFLLLFYDRDRSIAQAMPFRLGVIFDHIHREHERPEEERDCEEGPRHPCTALPAPGASAQQSFFTEFGDVVHSRCLHGNPLSLCRVNLGRSAAVLQAFGSMPEVHEGKGRVQHHVSGELRIDCGFTEGDSRRTGNTRTCWTAVGRSSALDRASVDLLRAHGKGDDVPRCEFSGQPTSGEEMGREATLSDPEGDYGGESVRDEGLNDGLPYRVPVAAAHVDLQMLRPDSQPSRLAEGEVRRGRHNKALFNFDPGDAFLSPSDMTGREIDHPHRACDLGRVRHLKDVVAEAMLNQAA